MQCASREPSQWLLWCNDWQMVWFSSVLTVANVIITVVYYEDSHHVLGGFCKQGTLSFSTFNTSARMTKIRGSSVTKCKNL